MMGRKWEKSGMLVSTIMDGLRLDDESQAPHANVKELTSCQRRKQANESLSGIPFIFY